MADIIPFPVQSNRRPMSARGAALNARLDAKIAAKQQPTNINAVYAKYLDAYLRHTFERSDESLVALNEATYEYISSFVGGRNRGKEF